MSEPESKKTKFLVRAAEIAAMDQPSFSHPLNPHSQISGVRLSPLVGLQRVGLSLARVPPGKESFIFHAHQTEEEFIYILSGRGLADIGEETFQVGPGDFMGFPTPSVGHHLRNPFEEELVYLMGGESKSHEIADFPRVGKRLVRCGDQVEVYAVADKQPFWPRGSAPK